MMNENMTKKYIDVPSLWKLFEKFLSVMGPAYVDHCVRTAYLTYRLCQEERIDSMITRKLVFAAYFHDIGSIGKPKEYLTHRDYDIFHSVDGYLLLRYKSPLQEWAKIILYHHVSYNHQLKDAPYIDLGLKISICDRFDDWERHKIDYDVVIENIKKQSGKAFNPKDVDALIKVIQNNDVRYDIRSGRYKDVLHAYVNSLNFSTEEIEGYISMLASLFELYNNTTYNHSKTVAIVSGMLANYLGYSEEDCFKMYIAGLIHDLGKIFIPLSILDKPAKLTHEEYEIMKKHIVYSRDLTIDIFPTEIVNIATYHHERLDGSGYPNQLVDRDMTELEEVMQVGDVVSALIARRPYKEEFPYERVRDILLEQVRFNKFNKKVVDTFIEYHEEILQFANKTINEGYEEASHMNEVRENLINNIVQNKAKLGDMPLSNFLKKE